MLERLKELEKELEKDTPELPPFPGEEELFPDAVRKALEEMRKQMEESRKRFDEMRKRLTEPKTQPEDKKDAEKPRRAPQPGQSRGSIIIKRLTWKDGKLVEVEEYKSDSALPGIAVTGNDSVMRSLRYHLELGEKEGVLVQTIEKDSPFAKAGLEKHDIITKVEDKTVGTRDELAKVLEDKEKVSVEVIHKGERKTLEVSLKDAGTSKGKKEEEDK
jgi:C-terminal processing protease CtpA/Prc